MGLIRVGFQIDDTGGVVLATDQHRNDLIGHIHLRSAALSHAPLTTLRNQSIAVTARPWFGPQINRRSGCRQSNFLGLRGYNLGGHARPLQVMGHPVWVEIDLFHHLVKSGLSQILVLKFLPGTTGGVYNHIAPEETDRHQKIEHQNNEKSCQQGYATSSESGRHEG